MAFLMVQIRLLMLVQGRGEIPDAKVDPDFAQECEEAMEYAEDALTMAKQSGNQKLLASVYCTVAQIRTAAMDTDKAFAAVDEALTIFRTQQDEVNTAATMCIEADVHLVSGNTQRALSVVNKALTIFRDHGDVRGEWVALGIVEHITGPPEEDEPEEQQWTEEQMQQYMMQQWQQQQQQEQALQPAAPQEQAVAKPKRAPRELTGAKLESGSLSMELVGRRLLEIVKVTADIEDDDELQLDQPLMQMGVTSKVAVVLRNALSEELPGVNLPHTVAFDYPTVNMMAEAIMEQESAARPRGKKALR